ncbi:MAG: hypothetical protein OXC57_14320, partial [Rhodobacteraceae bacterium]|nr:hypothetical protein [Paracoccaceae bacterium]
LVIKISPVFKNIFSKYKLNLYYYLFKPSLKFSDKPTKNDFQTETLPKFSQKDWIQSWPGLKPVGHEYHSPCPVCAAKTAFLFVQMALLPAGKTIVIIRTF